MWTSHPDAAELSASAAARSDDHCLAALASDAANWLLLRKARLASAESCTGGWIAKTCTDLAGSSDWFEGGVVSYSNMLKRRLLGVAEATLREHGAVSGECAAEMVAGVRRRLGGDLCVAVTGIAGPSGGSPGRPVGTVWIGWQWRDRSPWVSRFQFPGDRQAVRRQTAAAALLGLARLPD